MMFLITQLQLDKAAVSSYFDKLKLAIESKDAQTIANLLKSDQCPLITNKQALELAHSLVSRRDFDDEKTDNLIYLLTQKANYYVNYNDESCLSTLSIALSNKKPKCATLILNKGLREFLTSDASQKIENKLALELIQGIISNVEFDDNQSLVMMHMIMQKTSSMSPFNDVSSVATLSMALMNSKPMCAKLLLDRGVTEFLSTESSQKIENKTALELIYNLNSSPFFDDDKTLGLISLVAKKSQSQLNFNEEVYGFAMISSLLYSEKTSCLEFLLQNGLKPKFDIQKPEFQGDYYSVKIEALDYNFDNPEFYRVVLELCLNELKKFPKSMPSIKNYLSETLKYLSDKNAILVPVILDAAKKFDVDLKYVPENYTLVNIISAKNADELEKFFMENPDFNSNKDNGYGQTYFQQAVVSGSTEIVSILLKHGADANLPVKNITYSPLWISAALNCNYEMTLLLLDEGKAKFDLRDSYGNSIFAYLQPSKLSSEDESDSSLQELNKNENEIYELVLSKFFDKYWFQKYDEMAQVWKECKKLNPDFDKLEKIEKAKVIFGALDVNRKGGIIKYRESPGALKSPKQTLADGFGDCDDVSALCANAMFLCGIDLSDIYLIGFTATVDPVKKSSPAPSNKKENKKRAKYVYADLAHGYLLLKQGNDYYHIDPVNNDFVKLELKGGESLDDIKLISARKFYDIHFSERPDKVEKKGNMIITTRGMPKSEFSIEKCKAAPIKDYSISQIDIGEEDEIKAKLAKGK